MSLIRSSKMPQQTRNRDRGRDFIHGDAFLLPLCSEVGEKDGCWVCGFDDMHSMNVLFIKMVRSFKMRSSIATFAFLVCIRAYLS